MGDGGSLARVSENFCPTFQAKSRKPIVGNFNGFGASFKVELAPLTSYCMKKRSGQPQKGSKIAPPSVPPREAVYDLAHFCAHFVSSVRFATSTLVGVFVRDPVAHLAQKASTFVGHLRVHSHVHFRDRFCRSDVAAELLL